MSSQIIFQDQQEFEDGTRIFAIAYEVKGDPNFPEEIKFRFQYYDPDSEGDDQTVLRYDNCHEREGHKFHKHIFQGNRERIEPIEFQGALGALYDTFLKEVREYREK